MPITERELRAHFGRKPAVMREGRKDIPIMGVRLRKSGAHTVVDVEIGGAWIEVIRELSDGEFCHTVEPDGIYVRYYSMPEGLK